MNPEIENEEGVDGADEDADGKRYLDALAGLFSVNLGYGFGEEIGQAALEQMRELPFYTNWSYAHPRAIELAAEVASLAPGDLNRVFFVNGGSEAVEAACNTEVGADRRIDVRVLPRDEAFALPDIIRTATNLVPPEIKEVRIIDIVGLDQQADGGTHVASTRQVGRIEVVKIESKGKGFRRLRIRIAD